MSTGLVIISSLKKSQSASQTSRQAHFQLHGPCQPGSGNSLWVSVYLWYVVHWLIFLGGLLGLYPASVRDTYAQILCLSFLQEVSLLEAFFLCVLRTRLPITLFQGFTEIRNTSANPRGSGLPGKSLHVSNSGLKRSVGFQRRSHGKVGAASAIGG